jgi:DNA-binding transcriptional LysR family regulator
LLRTAQGEPLEEAQAALSPIPVQTHTLFNPTLNHVFSLLAAILPSVLQIVMVTASGYSVGIDVETRHRLRIPRARGLAGGLEAELPVVVDVMLPTPILTHAVAEFSLRFPDVPLRLYVEALGAVLKMVLEGTCAFGIVGTLPDVPEDVVREHLMEVQIVPVASPSHPLGLHRTPLTINDLSAHVQLVLTDRSSLSNGTEIGVVSTKPWRLADLGAKHAFLRAGMGWGGMPLHLVQTDIDAGTLVVLDVVEMPKRGAWVPLSAAFKADAPPGPAGRWLIERIKARAEKE